MATLRRYSIVRTRRPGKLFSTERAILGLFCVAAGAAVFLSVNTATNHEKGAAARLARGEALIKIPIAHQIATRLNRIGSGMDGKKTGPAPMSPSQIAALLEEKRIQSERDQQLALERRQQASKLFAQRNFDRTPVASIPPKQSPGFQELRTVPGAAGFSELPRWQPQ
ncbi:MAG: hypothetical protein NWT00_07900 [Beijerinckiaceae bacterium]|nr:hypothetical protein [Beijerinckiaceae bacterium]